MSFDPAFLRAFTVQRKKHRVYGVELRPFCLWHVLLLSHADSPFLRNGTPGWDDLLTAIGICSLQFPDATITKPRQPGLLQRLRLGVQVKRFMDYAGDYVIAPDFKVDVPESTAPKVRGRAPEPLAHFADLFAWGQWSEAEVWNLPLSRANWYRPMAIAAQLAQRVPISFKTEADREWMERLIELDKAERAKG